MKEVAFTATQSRNAPYRWNLYVSGTLYQDLLSRADCEMQIDRLGIHTIKWFESYAYNQAHFSGTGYIG
jgi:hypothetical protein